MATSIAFLGNAVYALQEADVIGYHPLVGWPRLPIYLAQATGYYPTRETVLAQAALLAVYLARRALDVRRPPAMQRRRRPSAPVGASRRRTESTSRARAAARARPDAR